VSAFCEASDCDQCKVFIRESGASCRVACLVREDEKQLAKCNMAENTDSQSKWQASKSVSGITGMRLIGDEDMMRE
jgi:hypothetical protein